MTNSRRLRAIPLMVFAVMFAAYVGMRGCAALDQASRMRPKPHYDAPEWPNPMMIAGHSQHPASPADRRFAIEVAKRQIHAFVTGDYDGVAMDEGRFVNSFQPPGPSYFMFMRSDGVPLRDWKYTHFGQAFEVDEVQGVWLEVELQQAGKPLARVIFYANPAYAGKGTRP